ncbi:MAG: MoxR family ATPase [Phycisphaeraceae bacterium]|nr:MAG: MoxR family ATPase [Phycisphaeraceae bacterium]
MTETAMTPDTTAASPEMTAASASMRRLVDAVGSVVVGQAGMVERLLIGLLTGGHVLLEGVPGLAKTLTVSALAGALDGAFSRIQFTPDLLPADLVGTLIYNPQTGEFTTRKGPVFANIVLADEINRAPAKVQSALLEAMQERSVTIGDATHQLPRPFLVLATQNPIEQEGTYPLPEAQVDRFMLKLSVGYPSKEEEREIVRRMASTKPKMTVDPVVSLDDIMRARELVDAVFVDEKIHDYAVEIVHTTREPEGMKGPGGTDLARLIEFGASPRASIALVLASKAHAFLQGRDFVTPSDVKSIALDVMRHRIIISYEAEAEGVSGDDIVRAVLDQCPVP